MFYFFPGPLETVDPAFDIKQDLLNPHRIRHQDDVYAHELLESPPYHGILLARSAVHPEQGGGRASFGLWQRLLREGARSFMRLDELSHPIEVMGDCGAYAYVKEPRPTVSVDDALEFYSRCGVNYGLSVDHVIPGYVSMEKRRKWRTAPPQWVERRTLTLELASEYFRLHRAGGYAFEAVGVAQGWDPQSYADSVANLQRMGYSYVALGGLARLSMGYIRACLEEVATVRKPSVRLHLLGVARPKAIGKLAQLGVVSFDSSAPLRQAFLNEEHNYYTPKRTFRAIRLPQATGNRQLRGRIALGEVRARDAFALERDALRALRSYDAGSVTLGEALERIHAYEVLFNGRDQTEAYRETLQVRPWRDCACAVCRALGLDIILLRGKQRNNRRGFHNLHVFFDQITSSLSATNE